MRHAELIVEWFLWTIKHTNRSLDIQCNVSPITGFIRHTMQVYNDKACDGRNVALNYQVTCWCTRLSKGTILLVTGGGLGIQPPASPTVWHVAVID